MPTVGDVMSRNLVTLPGETTIGDAVVLMTQRKVGSILILEGGKLAGIFTDRDVVRALSQDPSAPREPISGWMTPNPSTTTPGVDVENALEVMERGGFRHLPVLENGLLVGMASIKDLAHA